MADPLELKPHPESSHKQRVYVDGEHIANIHHRLRPVHGAGQSTFQPVWEVHPPEDKPDHFTPGTSTTLERAKSQAMLLSLHGDLKSLKVK